MDATRTTLGDLLLANSGPWPPPRAYAMARFCTPSRPPSFRGWLSDKPRGRRLSVRLAQRHDSGVNHFGRGGTALTAWAAFTRSAKTAIVRFAQPVWFVRRPRRKACAGVVVSGLFLSAGDDRLPNPAAIRRRSRPTVARYRCPLDTTASGAISGHRKECRLQPKA
jgi:hypothetical protein